MLLSNLTCCLSYKDISSAREMIIYVFDDVCVRTVALVLQVAGPPAPTSAGPQHTLG